MSEIILPHVKWDAKDTTQPSSLMQEQFLHLIRERFLSKPTDEEMDDLRSRVTNLEQDMKRVRQKLDTESLSNGEIIYLKLETSLLEKYSGRIVAINIENSCVDGIGNSIEEAYNEAIKISPGKRFYFRKVGRLNQTL